MRVGLALAVEYLQGLRGDGRQGHLQQVPDGLEGHVEPDVHGGVLDRLVALRWVADADGDARPLHKGVGEVAPEVDHTPSVAPQHGALRRGLLGVQHRLQRLRPHLVQEYAAQVPGCGAVDEAHPLPVRAVRLAVHDGHV